MAKWDPAHVTPRASERKVWPSGTQPMLLPEQVRGRRCGQVGPSPCYSQSKLCMHTKFWVCSSISFSGQNVIFGFFFQPYGRSFNLIFTKLALNLPTVTPITPRNLGLVGQSVCEEIANIRTCRQTMVNYSKIIRQLWLLAVNAC